MILSEYHAAVECRGTFQPLDTCSTIMDDMETSRDSLAFGPRGDPGVRVPIPLVMDASKALSTLSFTLLFSTLFPILSN